MSVSINIPEDLYQQAAAIAECQHVAVEEVLVSACAEQLRKLDRLAQRARLASREQYLDVLDHAPDVEPEPFDQL
jgi:hypothetical protein